MTVWCGAPRAGWSPWRVVGHEFENHWAVSMQNEKWINGTTDVLMPPNSQLGDLVCNPRRVLCVLWLLWEATKCVLLAFGCRGLCAGKDGEKSILASLLEWTLEHGKKRRSCLPPPLVLVRPIFWGQSPIPHFCFISVMKPLLNPWSPARWMQY